MSYARIEITIGSLGAEPGESFGFDWDNGSTVLPLSWECATSRFNPWYYENSDDPNVEAANIAAAMSLDLDTVNDFTITVALNVVTVEAKYYGVEFSNEFTDPPALSSDITFNIVAEVPPVDFEITGSAVAAASVNSKCTHVEYTFSVANGTGPYQINSPSVVAGLVIELPRGQTHTVEIEDTSDGSTDTIQVIAPAVLPADAIDEVTVTENEGSGGTATIQATIPSGLTVTYSIDGLTFLASNVFSGLATGSYTAYILDQYGCQRTLAFSIADYVPDPNFSYPDANPVRMVSEITPSACGPYDNGLNRLSYNSEVVGYKKFCYNQKYNQCDVIWTQFKTNYDTLAVVLKDQAGSTVQTPSIVQKSTNIGYQDKRDCQLYDAGSNRTGVYFTTGNLYTAGTLTVIGTYILNGQLPDYALVGRQITISGAPTGMNGTFTVTEVAYNSTLDKFVMIYDAAFASANETEPCYIQATYDKAEYEVYEFSVDCTGLTGIHYLELTASDSRAGFTSISMQSEYIDIQVEHQNLIEIKYKNVDNNYGIDFSTGIEFGIRFEGRFWELNPEAEKTVYEDDQGELVKLKEIVKRQLKLEMFQLPRFMIEKLRLILSMDSIYIHQLYWTTDQGMDISWYRLLPIAYATIVLQQKGYGQYNSDDFAGSDIDDNGLLLANGGYLKL